jgi:polysaccharide biosynthesis transport protein
MELKYFFSVLSRRKWLLLLVMLLSGAVTYYAIGKLSRSWKSSASISTGIINYKGIKVGEIDAFTQEFQINNKFGTTIEYMKSRPSLGKLTKLLVLHDLDPIEGEKPFRAGDPKAMEVLSKTAISMYLTALKNTSDTMGIADNDTLNLSMGRALEKALGYDYETLKKQLELKRIPESDIIKVEYKSDNPKLSYFVVKNFCNEFLKYHYGTTGKNTNQSLAFYNDLYKKNKIKYDSLTTSLNSYSKEHSIVALVDQSQAIVGQIRDLDARIYDEEKKVVANKEIFAVYDRGAKQWHGRSEDAYSSNVFNNQEVMNITNQINVLSVKYQDSGMKDKGIERQINDLKGKQLDVAKKIALARRKDNDVADDVDRDQQIKALQAESEVKASEKSLPTLKLKRSELESRKNELVNNNAEVKKFTQELEIAQKEYQFAADKQNQAEINKMSTSEERPMLISEPALPPSEPENNNRSLLSAFSGVTAASLATLFLFMLTYFDSSISSAFQFGKQVGLPILGLLNRLKQSNLNNFNHFFKENTKVPESEYFKESLRKIRHEIEVSGSKTFLFVSVKPREGKSFLAATLAYTLSLKNKKVLIVDTNFKNNTLTGLSAKTFQNNPIAGDARRLPGTSDLGFQILIPTVDIIGNKGGYNSPSELLSGVDFAKKMEEFKAQYDFIFLEAAHMNSFSDAHELVDFVEKVIPVFDASTSIKPYDQDGINYLKGLGTKILGAVLNKVEMKNIN